MGKAKKGVRKFSKKQAQANRRNKARGKRATSIKGGKKKKNELPLELSDSEGEEQQPVEIQPKKKEFLDGFINMEENDMDVQAFLEADFSSSEDEDENLEEPPTKKRKLNSEEEIEEEICDDPVLQHRKDLEKLKELDPELYEHLKNNAGNLLDFGASEEEEHERELEMEAEMEMDGGPEELIQEKEEESSILKVFKASDLEQLKREAAGKKPLDGFRKLVITFQNATSMQKQSKNDVFLHFADGEIFNDFMKYMITEAPKVMFKVLKLQPQPRIPKKILGQKEWHRLKPLCRRYISCLLNFLKSTTEETTQQFILFNIRPLIPFLSVLKPDSVALVKSLVRVWAYGKSTVKKDAFLTILEMSISMHHDILTLCLKQMYLTFTKSIKRNQDELSQRGMEFMISSMAELYGVNPTISFQHGFVYIRQLAAHLNKALKNQQEGTKNTPKDKKNNNNNKRKRKRKQKKTGKEAHLIVYNWRYLMCIKSFVKMVCHHVKGVDSELYPLVFPLVEIMLAVIRMHKGLTWFPLKLQYIEMLITMVHECKVHIPVAPLLIELLQWPGLRKRVKASTVVQLDIDFMLKVKNEQELRSKAAHEALVENVCRLLLSYFDAYSCCVAFPELAYPICVFLKKELKDDKGKRPLNTDDDNNSGKSKNKKHKHTSLHIKFKKQIQNVIKQLQENSTWIKAKRLTSGLAPKDITTLNTFEDEAECSPLRCSMLGRKVRKVASSELATTSDAVIVEPPEEKQVEEEDVVEPTRNEETENVVEKTVPVVEKTTDGDLVEELVLSDDSDDENEE